MNRIDTVFAELNKRKKKALITFTTAGDPTLVATERIVKAMVRAGADIVELGIPYSDPIAEGPVIQAANIRALKNQIRIRDIMRTAAAIRKQVQAPLLFLLYYNCILQYGPEHFFEECAHACINGLIIPDLPFEEQEELKTLSRKHDIIVISMVTPISNTRIGKIVKNARGFIYCVSSLGVTGVRSKFSTDFRAFMDSIRKQTALPRAIGFGISTPHHARTLKQYCEGIIVGSAIVKLIGQAGSQAEAIKNVSVFVRSMRKALDEK